MCKELYNNRDIENAITKVLQYIGTLFSAERSYVFLFHDQYYSNIAEWCKEGIEPQIDNLQNIPLDDYQVWLDELDRNKKMVINDVEEINAFIPTGYELLTAGNTKYCLGSHHEEWKSKWVNRIGQSGFGHAERTGFRLQTSYSIFLSLTMQRNENEKMLLEMLVIDRLTLAHKETVLYRIFLELKE